eukprot:7001052-Ditylum_brightwellii.AAC.1
MDINANGAIEFFTNKIKVTSKWPVPNVNEFISESIFLSANRTLLAAKTKEEPLDNDEVGHTRGYVLLT